jgi:hypothetical protein
MPKKEREKTKTFRNNPSFRMTFFLYDCLRFGVRVYYLLRILLITSFNFCFLL